MVKYRLHKTGISVAALSVIVLGAVSKPQCYQSKKSKMNKLNTLVFLEKTLDKSIEYSSKLTFDKKYPQHLFLISLYCRVVELTHSCTILMRGEIISSVPIILRTVLETFADLKNLSADENYVNFMRATYMKEWFRIFKEAQKGGNAYLTRISRIENLNQVYAEHENELNGLKKNHYTPLTPGQRFERAGMVDEYLSIYNFLCSHSHSDIRSLYSRYTRITGDDFTVICFKDPTPHDIALYSTTLCDILTDATVIIHKSLNSGLNSDVATLNSEWEELKSKLLTKNQEEENRTMRNDQS